MYLGLDIGTKRTGVAISIGHFARPYATLGRDRLVDELKAIIQAEGITQIIVGLPYTVDGGRSSQTEWVEEQINLLKNEIDIPVVTTDEHLTSVEARRLMVEQGLPSSEIDSRVDAKAAELILQQYLDSEA